MNGSNATLFKKCSGDLMSNDLLSTDQSEDLLKILQCNGAANVTERVDIVYLKRSGQEVTRQKHKIHEVIRLSQSAPTVNIQK